MAKKKSKMKEADDAGASSSFCDSMEATASLLFSDSNPFKRKLVDLKASSERKPDACAPELHGNRHDVEKVSKRMKAPLGAKTGNFTQNDNAVNETEKKSKTKRKREEVENLDEIDSSMRGEHERDIFISGAKRKNAESEKEEILANSISEEDGFDSEDKLLRTIFVGNLPLKVKKKVIIKEFTKFGEIESVRIRSIPLIDSKVPRKAAAMRYKINDAGDNVHAYIVFKAQKSAQDAQSLNMSMLGGHHLRVDRACPPRKKMKTEIFPLFDTLRTVFLGNLPFDVKDEEIYELFSSVKELENQVEGVRVIRDPNGGVGKGFAYLLLKTKEAATVAVKQRSMQIRERVVRIFPAKKESTPLKRKSLISSDKDDCRKVKRSSISSTPTKVKGPMSYQGLRANKSGGSKRPRSGKGADKGDERKEKRPAVAARKNRVIVMKGSDKTKLERKRKFENLTPEGSFHRRDAKRHKGR